MKNLDMYPLYPTNKLKGRLLLKALKEIQDGDIINLGQGIPTDIIPLLEKSNHLKNIHFTLESGVSGGIPLAVPDFGIYQQNR